MTILCAYILENYLHLCKYIHIIWKLEALVMSEVFRANHLKKNHKIFWMDFKQMFWAMKPLKGHSFLYLKIMYDIQFRFLFNCEGLSSWSKILGSNIHHVSFFVEIKSHIFTYEKELSPTEPKWGQTSVRTYL